MSAKHLPKNTTDPRTFRYNKAQKQQIVSAIGVTEGDQEADEVLKRVTADARVFLHLKQADADMPFPSKLKSQALGLLGPAQALHLAVQEVHSLDPSPLDADLVAAGCTGFSEVLDRLRSDLLCVMRAATLARHIGAKKPDNRALRYLIQELGRIYYETTGHAPHVSWNESQQRCHGAFFSFVKACLEPIHRPHSEAAVCQAIRRALEKSF